VISLKAGGVGSNLTAADTVIHYDPWWSPAVENQTTDRAHRSVRDKPVFVHKQIAAGSVEKKIVVMQQQKAALVDAIFFEDVAGRQVPGRRSRGAVHTHSVNSIVSSPAKPRMQVRAIGSGRNPDE
jgi:SNF2 family DNA or RNA helicase